MVKELMIDQGETGETDGFCNFAASAGEMSSGECSGGSSAAYGNSDFQQYQGLQPELFFKMSHEIYNYGEGLIGKVAADHSHKWIYKEPNDQEINFLSAWHNSADSDMGSSVSIWRQGVLLPHPSSSGYPFINASPSDTWQFPGVAPPPSQPEHHQQHFYQSDHNHRFLMGHHHQPQAVGAPVPPLPLSMKITPSMSSLEALLSKLPSVVPPATQPGYFPFH
ncbi:unnamed protein product, partial [Thlaspi arvense]